MSIASEISRINNNIAAAYDACEDKGAAMPQTQNSANLADTIDSIPGGDLYAQKPQNGVAAEDRSGVPKGQYYYLPDKSKIGIKVSEESQSSQGLEVVETYSDQYIDSNKMNFSSPAADNAAITALPAGQVFTTTDTIGVKTAAAGTAGSIQAYNAQTVANLLSERIYKARIDSSIDETQDIFTRSLSIDGTTVMGLHLISLGLDCIYECRFVGNNKATFTRLEETRWKSKTVNAVPNHYSYPSEKCMVDYIAATAYTKAQVDNLISAISTLSFEVAQTKPVSNIKTNVIYLIPKSTAETNNVYDEWIYVNNAWELIGSTQIDLSQYAQKSELPTKTSDLTNDSGFLTQHQDISGKADKATTLAGYGITNAYTKTETDQKVEAASPFIVNLYSDDNGGFVSLEINGAQLLSTCFDVQSNLPRCIRAYKIYGFESQRFVEIYIDMILHLGVNTYKWIGHTTDENGTVTMYSYQSTANNRIHFSPEGDPDAD